MEESYIFLADTALNIQKEGFQSLQSGVNGVRGRAWRRDRSALICNKGWEILSPDTIVGRNNSSAILTLVDRKTGYAMFEKLPQGKNAKALAEVVNRRLAFAKRRGQLFSITTDNGMEFSKFESMERSLKIPVYFAKPYCSNDKPHIEHLNGPVRQYIPKRVDMKDVTDEDVRKIERELNKRPRKKLNFRTPFEVFYLNLKECCT